MHFISPRHAVTVLAILLNLVAGTVYAQSSLFNIPTTDVMAPGTGYVEVDFDAHLRAGGYRSYGFVGVYGVNKKLEVGLNSYLAREGGITSPVEFQPNIKWQVYQNEAHGVAVSTGAIAYIPFKKKAAGSVASLYVVASKQFKGTYAPRFTTGGYNVVGRANEGSRYGALLGYEQPIHRRVTFITDWKTGKNRFGYLATGLGITLTKRNFLYTAYYFGNEGRGNNSIGTYYGFTF